MAGFYYGSIPPFWILMVAVSPGTVGGQRGDVAPDQGSPSSGGIEDSCSCNGSVVAGVIITTAVFLILATLWWCFQERRRKKLQSKPNPESVSRAAYDNPHFQGDELDVPMDGQARLNPTITTTPGATTVRCSTNTTTTKATSTTSTLERGKSTLERVMAAVIRSSRSDSSKRIKDDSCLEPKDVVVPLEGHDFTGLGFTVHGNLKEGLYVKEVMSRGPANESGRVVPGDRIVALTVLTEHMVFKDALTILSYASPYPVLLHLQKKPGTASFSASSSLSPKVKLSQGSIPCEKLIHPVFRSQSHGDLAKFEDIDIKRVKMGNFMPPSKSKSGLSIELAKTQVGRQVQRTTESRHSERAIDVPGVEVKSKSVVVDMDGITDDKVELTNVQVHHPMSSKADWDVPDTSIDLPTFQDANLTGVTENLKRDAGKISKPKFGVKVFSDLPPFKKNAPDVETGLGEIKLGSKMITPSVENENGLEMKNNEENSQIELGLDMSAAQMKAPNLDTSRDVKKSGKGDFRIGLPDINLPSLSFSSDMKKTSGIDVDVGDASKSNTALQTSNITLKSSLSNRNDELSKIEPEESIDDDSKINKSMGGFHIDINLPSFKLGGSVHDKDKLDNASESKKMQEIRLKGPEFNISMEGKSKQDIALSKASPENQDRSKHGFKMEMPDISLPSFKFKGRGKSKGSENEEECEKLGENEKLKVICTENKENNCEMEADKGKSKKESKHGLTLDMPDINLSSFGLKSHEKALEYSEIDPDEIDKRKYILETMRVDTPSDGVEADLKTSLPLDSDTEEGRTKRSKYGLKLGMPDVSLTSLNLKGKAKGEETIYNLEDDLSGTNHDININMRDTKTRNQQHGGETERSEHDFKLKMPDIHMPSLHIRNSQDSGDKGANINKSYKIEGADLSIPQTGIHADLKPENFQDSDAEDEKGIKKSKHGFRFGMPDISMPSFGLKSHAKGEKSSEDDERNKKEQQVDLNLEGDTRLFHVGLKGDVTSANKQDYDSEDDKAKKKSTHGFKMPSFGLKGHVKSEKEPSDYVKAVGTDISLPSVGLEAGVKIAGKHDNDSDDDRVKNKSKHGFKLPSFGFRGRDKDSDDDSDHDRKRSKESNVELEGPNFTMPSVDLTSESKSGKDPELVDERDMNQKVESGFRFGIPDLPSFGLRGHGKNEKKTEDEENGREVNQEARMRLEEPDIRIPSAPFEYEEKMDTDPREDGKTKIGFKIGIPSLGLKTREKGERDFDNSDDNDLKGDLKLKDSNFDFDVKGAADSEDEKETSKHRYRFGMPDISMPSFNLKGQAKNEGGYEGDKEHNKAKKEGVLDVANPDLNLSADGIERRIVSAETRDDDSDEETATRKSHHGFRIGMPPLGIKIPNKSDGDDEPEINLEGPKANFPSGNLELLSQYGEKDGCDSDDDKEMKRTKHRFKLPSFGFIGHGKDKGSDNEVGNNDRRRNKETNISTQLPPVELKSDSKSDKRKDHETYEENEKKNAKHGFRFGMPDISMPSFAFGSHNKSEKESEDEDYEGREKKEKSELNIKCKGTNSILSPVTLETKVSNNDDEADDEERGKKKSKHGFKIGMPTFGFNGSAKEDGDRKQNKGLDIKLDGANIDTPSLHIQRNQEKKHDDESRDEDDTKKKHGFRIGIPDINMPSFSLSGEKTEKDPEEIGAEDDVNAEVRIKTPPIKLGAGTKELESKGFEADITDHKRSSHEYKFKVPSFGLRHYKEAESDNEENNEHDHAKNKDISLPFNGPDISASTSTSGVYGRTIQANEGVYDRENLRDKREFLMEIPDINIPSFNFNKRTKGSGIEGGDDWSTELKDPRLDLDVSEMKNRGESSDQDSGRRSKHGFNIKMPDFNIPHYSFGLGHKNSEKEVKGDEVSHYNLDREGKIPEAPEADVEVKANTGDEFEGEKLGKSKYDIKIGMPDMNLPYTRRENVDLDLDWSNSKDKFGVHSKGIEGIDRLESWESESATLSGVHQISDRSERAKYDLRVDSPNIKLPLFHSKSEKSNDGASIGTKITYNIDGLKPEMKGVIMTDEDNAIVKFKPPAGDYAVHIATPDNHSSTSHTMDIEHIKKQGALRREYDLKLQRENINLQSGDVKLDGRCEIERGMSGGIKIAGAEPDLAIRDSREIRAVGAINPDFSINEDYSASKGVIYTEGDEKIKQAVSSSDLESEKKYKDDKKKKEKSELNFKFKGPDFSFPHVGAKGEKIPKEAKDGAKLHDEVEYGGIDANLSFSRTHRVAMSSNLPYGLKFDAQPTNPAVVAFSTTNIESPQNEASREYIYKSRIDGKSLTQGEDIYAGDSGNYNLEINQKDPRISFSGLRVTQKKFDVNQKNTGNEIPAFEIPNLKNVSEIVEGHFEIPDVGTSINRVTLSNDLKQTGSIEGNFNATENASFSISNNFGDEKSSEIFKDMNIDYSLPDEVKVVNSRTATLPTDPPNWDKTENCDQGIISPSTNLSNIKSGQLSSENAPTERATYRQKITVSNEITNMATESLEEVRNGGLNATDAAKKKISGFKISNTEISIPSFGKDLKPSEVRHGLDVDKNQSDEMKSYKLKLKAPSVNGNQPTEAPEDEECHNEICAQLPRVKISAMKSKNAEAKQNWSEKLNIQYTEDVLTQPLTLPSRISLDQSVKENESDERKIKEVNVALQSTSVSLLREKFNTKMKENASNSPGVKSKIEADLITSKEPKPYSPSSTEKGIGGEKNNFNMDDPDFLIPGLKGKSEYDSTLLTESFEIPTLNLKDGPGNTTVKVMERDLKWKNSFSKSGSPDYGNYEFSESTHYSRGEQHDKSKPLDFNASHGSEINFSLDSSSVETESDLPEADSDLKKASRHFSLDVPIPKLSLTKMNLEKSFNKDIDPVSSRTELQLEKQEEEKSTHFGNVFGFRGFKKYVDVSMTEPMKEGERNIQDGSSSHVKSDKRQLLCNQSVIEKSDSPKLRKSEDKVFTVTKDLPEVDYDLDFNDKSNPESDITLDFRDRTLDLPEGDQSVISPTNEAIPSREMTYNLKVEKRQRLPTPELEKKSKAFEMNFEIPKATLVDSKEIRDEPTNLEFLKKVQIDGDKSKSKMKIGLDFGFKGFNKTPDSDEGENKIYREPEGDTAEPRDKTKLKPKKTFSFKGFGKSSSDTEEETFEKVSDHPMDQGFLDDKVKINKTGINFGLKPKGSKSSDSDDNGDTEKVELNPQVQGNQKKPKIKSNLGFAFMNKSKISESESIGHSDGSLEDKREHTLSEENKGKAKINISTKRTRERYDTRSESEGGEDEKMSMDSRGEDHRSKSRYGIGFGFKKGHGKTSSDSDCGENDEQKVYLDERSFGEKTKEHKSKSLKLGFKGFKNLKGKIQTEINKIRHESPSSDEESVICEDENQYLGEKRKKLPQKKGKDKKVKREMDKGPDVTEEAIMTSVTFAVKENRWKKFETKTSSSSSDSTSGDEERQFGQKKKKKSKLKRKEDGKIVTTNVMGVSLPQESQTVVEVDESKMASHITIISSESGHSLDQNSVEDIQDIHIPSMELESDPQKNIITRKMNLQENITQIDSDDVSELIEKEDVHNDISRPLILKGGPMYLQEMEADCAYWESDSDVEKRENANSDVNLSKTSAALTTTGKQMVLTDSEELKRKAASLGDLSRLYEGCSTGTLLERAVSLDLKNASVGYPSLHVRRLQLPDSSATSIDEVDEQVATSPTKKLEITGGLKAAGQWGTLEDAMSLGVNDNKYFKPNTTMPAPNIEKTAILKSSTTSGEGGAISNIEISGERGSSITSVSGRKDKCEGSFGNADSPSLSASTIPMEKTTITVVEENNPPQNSNEYSGSDSNIVVVGTEAIQSINNFHNLNFQLNPTLSSPGDPHLPPFHGLISNTNTNSDSGRYSPRSGVPLEKEDSRGVTLTMVPAECHLSTQIVDSGREGLVRSTSPQPPQNRGLSSLPELLTYDDLHESPHVTVSHNWIRENGDVIMETSEHNISDEFLTPDSSPQKSMTQITLDGDCVSGYTVTEGTISRTVIISNPDSVSPVNIVKTESNDLPHHQI